MLEGDMEQGLKGEVGDKGSGVDSQYRMAVARTIGGQSKAWLKYSKYFELEWGSPAIPAWSVSQLASIFDFKAVAKITIMVAYLLRSVFLWQTRYYLH